MTRPTLPTLVAIVALAATPLAAADPAPAAAPAAPAPIEPPRFELLDRGDAVEIIAHNIKAARTAILPVRSRLEVPIVAAGPAKRVTPSDATVKLIELAEESTPVLSVKLAFERADVKALSRFAQAIQVGDDLHLIFPRKLPEGDAAPRLPDPTLPPALAAKITPSPTGPVIGPKIETRPAAAIAPAVAPEAPAAPVLGPRPDPTVPKTAAKAEELATMPAPVRPRTAADAIAAAGAPMAPPAAAAEGHALRPTLAPDHGDDWSKISLYAALGLAAAGGGIWMMRRRRGRPGASASIEVIAQRSLGGKARIVWLAAGQHEMIVSVTSQQVRMLSQWRKTERPAVAPEPHNFEDELRRTTTTLPPPVSIDKPLSPAVSGLLRLRRTSQMAAVAVDPAESGELPADDVWAREILAATGARR